MDRGYFKLMARLLLSAGLLGTGITAHAADDSQTAITGTPDPDVIDVSSDQAANATASSSDSGSTSAAATGVDAQDGDDAISGANAISTIANAEATLLTVTQKTTISATATGVDAGDGDDTIDGSLAITSNATASVAYGAAINYPIPPSPIPQPDKADTSVTAEASANGLVTGAGADSVTSKGALTLSATSTAAGTAPQIALQPRDKMNVKTAATANATAVAINTDADADTVTNHGAIDNHATATSGALALALTTQPGKKVQIKSEASANSSASATGIDTSGDGTEDSSEDTKPYPIGGDGLEVAQHKVSISVAADDIVDNDADITNTATATSGAGSVALGIKVDGSVDATASSNASAITTGITTGGGNDHVTNSGVLTATSAANAGAVSIGLEVGAPSSPAPTPAPGDPPSPATPSEDKDNKSSTNTNVTADARSAAIDVSGSGQTEQLDRHAQIADGAITIDEGKSTTADTDEDVVANTGNVNASAHATAGALSASITQSSGGSADSQSNSTATSYAAGVLAGAGSDQVANSGTLTIDATSDATGLTVGVAVGKPADPAPSADAASAKVASNNSTTVEASAEAVGIDAEGTSSSSTSQRHAALSRDGLQLNWGNGETGAAGDDTVTNDGILSITSRANAGAGSFGATLNSAGSANADATATAKATTTGIFTGAGADSVTNNVALTATSNADAKALSVALVASKPATASASGGDTKPDKTSVAVKAGATAEANAFAIDTEGTLHQQTHDNSVAIDANGLQLSMSRDDSSLAGDDTVVNHGAVLAGATADSGVLALGLNVGAQGSVDADASSTATASSTAIHTGGGADSITNTETLGATSSAHALALTATVSATRPGQGTGGDDAVTVHSVGNATADATAFGIDAEGAASGEQTTDRLAIDRSGLRARRTTTTIDTGGDDVVTNTAGMSATSTASATTAAVAISVNSEGTTASETNAATTARASGILTGAGSDTVTNDGTLDANATTISVGVSLSFVMSKEADTKATANATSSSDASAVGISTGAQSARHVRDTRLTLNNDGLSFVHSDDIDADTGADVITNRGALSANASSTAGAIGAAIAIDGSASSDVTATATSRAAGLDAGGGADQVTNDATLGVDAHATAGALALAFGQAGTEKTRSETSVNATASADSAVTGIAADSGGDSLTGGSLAIDSTGLAGDFDYQRTASTGDDTVVNRGVVNASATALSGALGMAAAIDGAAKADVKSTATARATAIDGGGGNDSLRNDAVIAADARSNSAAVALGVGAKTSGASAARASVDATSTAEANSVGIAGDGAARNEIGSGRLAIDASGLDLQLDGQSTAVAGNDTIDNRNGVSATSVANSGTLAVAVSIKGAANATANTLATSNAAALDAGGGADTVTNTGALVADSAANAATINAAISTEGRAASNAGIMGAGTTAQSRAVGIAGAGLEENKTLSAHEVIDFDDIGVTLNAHSTTDSITADGADTITNSGTIDATSNANAPRVSAGITGKGVALSLGRVSADSAATGIDGGNRDDSITNTATINATSGSIAFLANVAVTGKGLAVAANNVWDGGTEATSVANGIDADGGSKVEQDLTAEADADLARVRYTKETAASAGNDTIRNSGAVTAIAAALAPSVNVAVSQNGVAAAVSTATAKAEANALRGGDLADDIDNAGHLVADSDATAAAANVAITNNGVAAAADAVWKGGTTADARSRGIDGDGGDRTHTREISVGTDGIRFDDDGVLADGADIIHNTGVIESNATSRALSVAVAASMNGVAAATATSNSTADAAAIDAGQGAAVDHVTNTGHLTTTADALAASASISFTNNGAALSADSVWDGGTKANARARGIDVGTGGETIANSGAIDTSATANGASAAISASVNGFAAAVATATGSADAAAIDAAAGDDVDDVTNSGALTASATSNVYTAAISFTNNGAAAALDAVWDGGTTANARARGIGTGNASDTVHNTGAITANGDARALALSVGIAVNGVAAAATSASAFSDAAAIDLGDDLSRDVVTNGGELISDSKALSATASISVTSNGAAVAADAPWEGGTTAGAVSRGVRTSGGADDIDNTAHVSSHAEADALAASIAIAVNGFAGAEAKSTATADSIALDAGGGDDVDHVTNSGLLESRAEANAFAAAVSFTANGVAGATGSVWDGGTRAQATTAAVSLGGGADTITNTGRVDTNADAISTGVSIAVAVNGVAGAITAARSDATAFGIDAADGDDQVTTSARMDVGAFSDANTISVSGAEFGLAASGNNFWDGGTTSVARATAINAGTGVDTIRNTGDLFTNSHSVSPSVAVGFTVGGVSAAVSTATSSADSRAIDGGDDADALTNSGRLTVSADADAYAVNVAITGVGAAVAADSVWDGGTTANALANAIDGGAGNDAIANNSANAVIDSHASASTLSVAVSVSGSGFSGSTSTSTANANAAAIDAGTGNDTITNQAAVTGRADSTATAVSVSITGAGGAVATDAFWDGGTKANSTSAALAGGDGNDVITNSGAATARSDSDTLSATIAFALSPTMGLSFASAASTSTSDATVLATGAGDDQITNTAALSATSDANATGLSVAFATGGGAVAGNVDARTVANGTVTGISGGDGNDTLRNLAGGNMTLDAGSQTKNVSIALTLGGGALADASSTATSRGFALDGGAGNDVLRNEGAIGGTIHSSTDVTGVSAVAVGAAGAFTNSIANAQGAAFSGGDGDDQIVNVGNVALGFSAVSEGFSVSASLAGFVLSQANAESNIDAAGARGDDGADTLVNDARLSTDANAYTRAQSVSASVGAYTVSAARSTAFALNTGLSGGAGDDTISNLEHGAVNVRAGATVNANSFAVSIASGVGSDARTLAQVNASGLSGGSGNDSIANLGSVTVRSAAASTADGQTINIVGDAGAQAGVESKVDVVGIEGGTGRDVVVNTGSVTVGPDAAPDSFMARLTATSQSLQFGGTNAANSSALADTRASGITLGADDDMLRNEGTVSVIANAYMKTESSTISVFGSSGASGDAGAFTSATGLDGNSGNDVIESLGDLSVLSDAQMTQTASNYTFGGAGSAGATAAAVTEAWGIVGGDGNDAIANAATINITANSTMAASGNSETDFGDASANVVSGSTTRASALVGGAGDDTIENRVDGIINLNATARVTTDSVAYTFAGSGPTTGAAVTGDVTVEGISGDAGNDRLLNRGAINITADTSLTSTGGSKAELTGLSDPESTGISKVAARIYGMTGGDGDDLIGTYGTLNVTARGAAEAVNDATTGTFSVVNGNTAGAIGKADVSASGIDGGSGVNRMELDGNVNVLAEGTGYALASSSGATISFGSDGHSSADATAFANATGVGARDGDDTVINSADVAVTAHATTAKQLVVRLTVRHDVRSSDPNAHLDAPAVVTANDLPPIGAANPENTVVFWTKSQQQDPTNPPDVDGGYWQVQNVLVAGSNPPRRELRWQFLTTGLYVTDTRDYPVDTFPSYAAANGNGLDGEGDAYATATATANARGVTLGGGNNIVDNSGTLTVKAIAEGIVHVSADGDAFGDANGNTTATATATAIGVELGAGNDQVRNTGTIDVLAQPIAQARSEASGGDICIWFFGWWCGGGGDGEAYAFANFTADATGVRDAGGNNLIINDGTINVAAQPDVHGDVRTGEFVAALYAQDSGYTLTHYNDRAVGIQTGAGNDTIINNGTIRAVAYDLTAGCSTYFNCPGVTANPPGESSLSAAGILTGDGDDIVRNNGTIDAHITIAFINLPGVAIDTGAGNDTLELGDGSAFYGSASLGTGDDTLILTGTPQLTNFLGTPFNVDAGDGIDTLVLNGAGSYAGTPLSIERATKLGVGTYTLPSLATVQRLVIDQGTLRLGSGYAFGNAATFSTFISTDGTNGQVSVGGDANLAGSLAVEKRGGDFIANGTRYTVVHADGNVAGAFGTVALPTPMPLLQFQLDQGVHNVDVVAKVPSFSTVTQNPLYQQIAGNLDTIAGHGDEDLSQLLGRLQTMRSGFDQALASFSPESHLATQNDAFTNLHEMSRALRGHISESRTRYRLAPFASGPELSLQFSGGSSGLGQLYSFNQMPDMPDYGGGGGGTAPGGGNGGGPGAQFWMLGLDASGKTIADEGFTGSHTDTRGFLIGGDHRIGENWMVGGMIGRVSTDVETGTLANGKIQGSFVSMYGTWFTDTAHLEFGATTGGQDYRNVRTLAVGTDTRVAESKHGGNAWNAFASGGINLGNERWSVEPFISFDYFSADEDAFEEIGAGALDQLVDARSSEALHGALGANFAIRQKLRHSVLDWHASLAVDRDFGIDDSSVSWSYAGAPQGTFTLDGRPMDDISRLYGFGVSLIGEQSAFTLDWRGLKNDDREEKFISARVSLRF